MDGTTPSYEELRDQNRRQARLIEELRAAVEGLKKELEESRRAGQRPAAPFSKGPPQHHPKQPGRKPGHPPRHRAAPPPEQVDRTVEVPLPAHCPECRAPLDDAPVAVHDQDPIDRPEPQPVVTWYRVPVTRCPACSAASRAATPTRPPTPWGRPPSSSGPGCSSSPPT